MTTEMKLNEESANEDVDKVAIKPLCHEVQMQGVQCP